MKKLLTIQLCYDFQEKLKVQDYTSLRKKIPVCDVWEGMTIEELSKAIGKDVGTCSNYVLFLSITDCLFNWLFPIFLHL